MSSRILNDRFLLLFQFEKFLSVMTSNVVDSNMFIRSAVLSHEKFVSAGTNLKCQLGNMIKKWEHKIYLMYKLVTAISVDSLTQVNKIYKSIFYSLRMQCVKVFLL